MKDPAEVGRRVLEALARGRQRRLEARARQAAELRELVERAARLDRVAGKPTRGQAGRIALRLQLQGVVLSERWARKILSELSDTGSTTPAKRVRPWKPEFVKTTSEVRR